MLLHEADLKHVVRVVCSRHNFKCGAAPDTKNVLEGGIELKQSL